MFKYFVIFDMIVNYGLLIGFFVNIFGCDSGCVFLEI